MIPWVDIGLETKLSYESGTIKNAELSEVVSDSLMLA